MIVANHQRYCQVVGATIGRFHARQFGLNRDTGPEPPGQVLRLTRREEEAPAADGDEIATLRAIVEGTARGTGEVFFQSLVRHLATAISVDYAFVAEFADKRTRVRTLAYWGKGEIRENVEFGLTGTLRGCCAWGTMPSSLRRQGEIPAR